MRVTRLHASRRNRPPRILEIHLGPAGPTNLAGTRRGEHEELECEPSTEERAGVADPGERGRDLCMRERRVMGLAPFGKDGPDTAPPVRMRTVSIHPACRSRQIAYLAPTQVSHSLQRLRCRVRSASSRDGGEEEGDMNSWWCVRHGDALVWSLR